MSDVTQLQFPNREQHPSVRVSDPDTCVEPSEPKMSAGRTVALLAHAAHSAGLTDFELADLTGIQQQSIGKRRGDLVKVGLIVATLERRPAPSGASAIVWRITPSGESYAQHLKENP